MYSWGAFCDHIYSEIKGARRSWDLLLEVTERYPSNSSELLAAGFNIIATRFVPAAFENFRKASAN